MNIYFRIVIFIVFVVVEAIFEEMVNEKLQVKINAPSSANKIISRTITLCAGSIMWVLVFA